MNPSIINSALCAAMLCSLLMLVSAQRGSLSEEAERVIREGSRIDTSNPLALIDLVERHQASGCLQRVICELTVNQNQYGAPGQQFGRNLLKFRTNTHPKAKPYGDAMAYGAQIRGQNVAACATHFRACNQKISDIIMVGNRILGR